MAPRVKKVESNDEVADKFTKELSEFLTKSVGVSATSLKEGGSIPYWIDTGSYALNWIISNDFFKGIPGARIIIISGLEGKGKSFLLDNILGNNVKEGGASFKVMIEAASNYEFSSLIVGSPEIAEKINIIKAFQLPDGSIEPITIEKLTSILYKTIDFQVAKKEKKNKSIVFGIDSITQLTSEKELQMVEKRASGKQESKDMTSAVKMRELFRTIEQQLEYANMTIIGIGQLTANITTGWAPPGTPKEVVNVKGSGGKYASSLIIQMVSDKEIKDAKTDTPIGIKMKLKTIKNRIQFRGRTCYLYFYFARGVDKFGGLCDLLARYGVIEAFIEKTNAKGEVKEKKATPSSTGEYDPVTTIFRYNGKTFSYYEIEKFVNENGGIELLKEWNKKLNDIYDSILQKAGVTDAQFLTSDEFESEDGITQPYLEDEN